MEERFIGNYKVLEKIGAGGMAKVYLAVHKDVPNLKVVLKVLSNPRLAERFRQEADKLALLDGHPNICRIKHFFNYGDDFVIAMEYIDGTTLDEKVKESERLTVEETLKITSEVLSILEAAHEKDIFHRDIKPSNIMLDKNGRVKIIDFGIAKGKSDPNLTITGTAAGTPAYMAPEQFTPEEGIDYAKVDIYAVGTTMYRLLSGELPFKGDNEFALRDAKLFNEIIPPRKLNSDIPAELEDVILKALEKEPENRYSSIGEMRQSLSLLLPNVQEEATSIQPRVHKPPPVRKPSKKPWPLIGGVVAVALVIIVLYSLFGPDKEQDAVENIIPADTSAVIEDIPAEATLVLSVIPSGDIYIGDEIIGYGLTDTTLRLDTGLYVIRAENSDAVSKSITDTISLALDEILPRRFTFEMPSPELDKQVKDVVEQKPPVQQKQYGKVLVGSRPRGADIYIDGKLQDAQTPYTFTLETGQHVFKLLLSIEGTPFEYFDTVNVSTDSEQRVFFTQ
jgi:serine/threonine protein kinase